jgi:hypothetical protein
MQKRGKGRLHAARERERLQKHQQKEIEKSRKRIARLQTVLLIPDRPRLEVAALQKFVEQSLVWIRDFDRQELVPEGIDQERAQRRLFCRFLTHLPPKIASPLDIRDGRELSGSPSLGVCGLYTGVARPIVQVGCLWSPRSA